MKKFLVAIIVIICLLSACSGVSQEQFNVLQSKYDALQSQLPQTPTPAITPESTPTPTPEPTLEPTVEPSPTASTKTIEEIKAENLSLRDTAKKLDYTKYFRNSDSYPDSYVYFTGKIIQVMDDGDNNFELRIAVNNNYNNIAYVVYVQLPDTDRLLENDKVKVYGYTNGLFTYQSTGAGDITIPNFLSTDIELTKK